MGNTSIKQNQKQQNSPEPSKNQRKRYHIENANNFICYQKLRLLVSQPKKYLIVHIVILCGMIYFYALTFVVGLIVYEINYFIIVLHLIAFCFMSILGFKNPGIVLKIKEDFDSATKIQIPFDRDSKPAINEMAKSYAFPIKSHSISIKFCPECLIFKPPRTVHCWVCNACINRMDHHCPFIGNCVGKGNYHIFFSFVSTLTIKLILIITQLIIMIVRLFEKDHVNSFQKPELYFAFFLLIFAFVVLTFVGSLMSFHVYLIINSITTNELCKKSWKTLSGNPFRKNFCLKNITRFIRGPSDQSIPQSHQNFQKSMIPRYKDKSQQCLSSYSSEYRANQTTSINQNAISQLKQLMAQKPQMGENNEMTNTQQHILPRQKENIEI